LKIIVHVGLALLSIVMINIVMINNKNVWKVVMKFKIKIASAVHHWWHVLAHLIFVSRFKEIFLWKVCASLTVQTTIKLIVAADK
jgi:hypothetical protein